MSDYGDAMRDAFMTDNLRAGLTSNGDRFCVYCVTDAALEDSTACGHPDCQSLLADDEAKRARELARHINHAEVERLFGCTIATCPTIPAPAMPEKVSA